MAVFALLTWPVLALVLFARLPVVSGIIWVVVLPYLYLPEAFAIDLPGLPDIDKTMVISIGLMLCLMVYRPRLRAELGASAPPVSSRFLKISLWICVLVLLAGLFVTVMNNREPLQFGPTFIPGTRPWDALSGLANQVLRLLPFFIAIRYLSNPQAHHALLVALVVSALAYSMFMLIEMRLSPQFHVWAYGYHQHSFLQHVRDGFRPKVFLDHGLSVGFYVLMALMSAAALWKVTQESKWLWATLWIFLILSISSNLGAFVIGLLLLGVFFWGSTRVQCWFVFAVALAVLLFPILRQAQLVPTEQLVAAAESISAERAQSLEFRFTNEDAVLERAWEKKWTGWGGWGRNAIYNDWGQSVTTFDGLWAIQISTYGWIGYLSFFGFLTLPSLLFARQKKGLQIPTQTMALALIAAGNLIYLIPNSTLSPVGLLVFGGLAGFVLYQKSPSGQDVTAPVRGKSRAPRYTRFDPPKAGAVRHSRLSPRP